MLVSIDPVGLVTLCSGMRDATNITRLCHIVSAEITNYADAVLRGNCWKYSESIHKKSLIT
jgi:hypothetical protein